MVTLFLISLLGAALGVVVLAALLVAALVFMARANEAHDGDVYDTDIRGCRANPVFLPDDDGAVDGCGCEDCVAENDPVRAYGANLKPHPRMKRRCRRCFNDRRNAARRARRSALKENADG